MVEAIRAGRGPVVVEATTYRWHGHYEGDPQRYRSPDEVREWEARDPLLVHARRLRSAGVSRRRDRVAASRRSRDELDDAVEAARGLAAPAAATLTDFVVRPRPERPEPPRARRRCADVPHDGRDPRRARGRARRRRARVRRRHRRRGRAATSSGSRAGSTTASAIASATPRSPRRAIVGLGVGAAMAGMRPGRRADVPRLRRRLPRPAAQPGGEAAVHDRRRRARWR